MRLQDLHWMDVERYLLTDSRILLVIGATAQHGYLSLLTDSLIPARLADAAIEREPVLVAPPLHFSISDTFGTYPGTITLSPLTFEHVITEMIDSLFQHGFNRFFILNGHGGNRPPARLEEMMNDDLLRFDWFNWWSGSAARDFEAAHGLHIDHANWGENFRFVRVSDDIPTGEKQPINLSRINDGASPREVMGDGMWGGAYQIDDARMEALFTAIVGEIVNRLRALKA